MIKILILNLFLLSATNVLSFSEVAPSNDNNVMENFAEHTASVTKELLAKLLAKTERTSKTLESNIELAITSAVNQLSQPIADFQKKIESSQCQPLITLEQLSQQIDSDLSNCMQNLYEILNNLKEAGHEFKGILDKSIKDIINLPKKCEMVESDAGFGSKVSCYIDHIREFNEQIALMLNSASKTLAHTRQLAEIAMQEGRTCANEVIVTTADSLDKILSTCQLNGQ